MSKLKNKKSQYIFVVFILLFIIMCLILGKYLSAGREGFVIGGNRLVLTMKKQGDSVVFSINKSIASSNAYLGIVNIAVSPFIPEGKNSSQSSSVPVLNYEFNFTSNKKEQFSVQFPYWEYEYIVIFKAGTEQVVRRIKHYGWFKKDYN